MAVVAGVLQLHGPARAYGRRAVEIARGTGNLPAVAYVLLAASSYDVAVGRWAHARSAVIEGLQIVERLGDHRRRGELAALLAQVMYNEGQFERLAEGAAGMFTIAGDRAAPQLRAHALEAQAWHLLPQGRHAVAAAKLEEAMGLLAGRGSRADEIHVGGMLAVARLRNGDDAYARQAARRAAASIRRSRAAAMHILEGYAGVAEVYLELW